MADIHVLDGDGKGETQRFVFHFPVPTGDNSVGTPWRQAVVACQSINNTTQLPEGDGDHGTILLAEKSKIAAGEVHEFPFTLTKGKVRSGGESLADLQRTVRHYYRQQRADQTAQLATKLRFFGYTESEG